MSDLEAQTNPQALVEAFERIRDYEVGGDPDNFDNAYLVGLFSGAVSAMRGIARQALASRQPAGVEK